jgi:hypothetical protein
MAAKKNTRPRSASASVRQQIETQRQRLLGADAIVVCVRAALESQLDAPDEVRIGDALQVASDIINDSVAALEAACKAAP